MYNRSLLQVHGRFGLFGVNVHQLVESPTDGASDAVLRAQLSVKGKQTSILFVICQNVCVSKAIITPHPISIQVGP